jgi:hypothetical protein
MSSMLRGFLRKARTSFVNWNVVLNETRNVTLIVQQRNNRNNNFTSPAGLEIIGKMFNC